MLVAVFESEGRAREASRALQALDEADSIDVHAAALVTKGDGGQITVLRSHRLAPDGTLGATALGTLIGMLGGPAGAAIGAASGLALGAATDASDMKVARRFLADVEGALEAGHSAVVAQIYEEDPGPVDRSMADLGGLVSRRGVTDVTDEQYEEDTAAGRRRL